MMEKNYKLSKKFVGVCGIIGLTINAFIAGVNPARPRWIMIIYGITTMIAYIMIYYSYTDNK